MKTSKPSRHTILLHAGEEVTGVRWSHPTGRFLIQLDRWGRPTFCIARNRKDNRSLKKRARKYATKRFDWIRANPSTPDAAPWPPEAYALLAKWILLDIPIPTGFSPTSTSSIDSTFTAREASSATS